MYQLSEPVAWTRPNAWGKTQSGMEQPFAVEETDVGRSLANWLGHRQPARKLGSADIGKIVLKMWDNAGWECWG